MVSYLPTITRALGFSPTAQLCISAGCLSLGIPATILGALIIDRLGRVRMIVTGTIIQVALLCIETALTAKYAGTKNRAGNSAAVAIIFLFFLTYGSFVEGSVFTYVSELFPNHLRARGVTWGISNLYLVNIAFTS